MTTIVKSIPSFHDANLTADQLRTVLMLCGAAVFGALLHASYGLDLSYGFF